MFFALCLLTAACADAEKPPKGAVTLIYMIGDGLGLAQVSMPVIGGGYGPKGLGPDSDPPADNRVPDSAAA